MQTNNLYRIKNSTTMLAGVSQGLAEYFNVDVTIIRILFVVLFFTPFPVGIIYFILWAVLPVKNEFNFANITENPYLSNLNTPTTMNNNSKQSSITGGVILIILGSIFAIKEFFDVNLFHYVGRMWPLFLVGLGVWLIVRDRNDSLPPSNNL